MSNKRLELERQEKKIISEIEIQSKALKKKIEKIIKTSLIIGTSVWAGYTIYNMLSDDKNPSKKKKASIFRNPLIKNILESVLKKGIEMIVEGKIKKK